jgi:hypothetical protein
VTYSPPVLAFFPLFCHPYTHGRILFHQLRQPRGLRPENFTLRLLPVHAAGANPESARNQPATEKPAARNYREISAKLPRKNRKIHPDAPDIVNKNNKIRSLKYFSKKLRETSSFRRP